MATSLAGFAVFSAAAMASRPASNATAAPDRTTPLVPRKLRRVTSNPVEGLTMNEDMEISCSVDCAHLMPFATHLFPGGFDASFHRARRVHDAAAGHSGRPGQ